MYSKLFFSLLVIHFLCYASFTLSAMAQEPVVYDTIEIATAETFVLNSINKTNLTNGRNRNAVTYNLKPNIKHLYLRVMIENADFQIDKKNYQSLLNKFTSIATNQYMLFSGSMIIEAISPKGSGKLCDFYLPKTLQDYQNFIADGHPWKYKTSELSYISSYTRLNVQSFAVEIDMEDLPVKDQLWLAFQNHSMSTSCKIIIDLIGIGTK